MKKPYTLISGKYKGYEVCWADRGQIFPRDGWYLVKSKKGNVTHILYLEEALKKWYENIL